MLPLGPDSIDFVDKYNRGSMLLSHAKKLPDEFRTYTAGEKIRGRNQVVVE